MSATQAGGLKIAAKLKKKDPDFYRKIGAIGGSNGRGDNTGFALLKKRGDIEIVRNAGRKGGTKSRRKKRVQNG